MKKEIIKWLKECNIFEDMEIEEKILFIPIAIFTLAVSLLFLYKQIY